MISQAPIFFPILFATCSEFVSSHILAIKRFAQFGVHIWYWLSLDKLRLDGCMTIYDVTEEPTCIPSHIFSVIEDVKDIKGCTSYIKKKVGVIKRFITLIHNSVWLQWWREAPSSSPYYIMKVNDVTFTIQSAETLVRISHKYDIKECWNVALMTRGLGNKISTPIDLTRDRYMSSKERVSHMWEITFQNIIFSFGCLYVHDNIVEVLPTVISIHRDSKPSTFISAWFNLRCGRSACTLTSRQPLDDEASCL